MWTVPARDQYTEQIPDPVLGDKRQGRSYLPAEEASELFGRIGDEFAVALQDRRGIVELVEHRAAHDVTDLVELKLEAGDDTEVAAAAAQGPEQVFVLVIARSDLPAIGENDIGRQQVVDGEPDAAGQVADAATQRQATHPSRRDDPAGRRQAERVGRMVDITPRRAAPNPGDLLDRVDPHVVHLRQVDDQTVVHRAESGNAVAPTTNCQVEAGVAASSDRGHHVGRIHALDDGAGLAVVHGVVDSASVVVVRIRGGDDATPHRFGQCLDRVAHWVLLCSVLAKDAPSGVPESVPSQPDSLRRPVAARNAGRSWPDGIVSMRSPSCSRSV